MMEDIRERINVLMDDSLPPYSMEMLSIMNSLLTVSVTLLAELRIMKIRLNYALNNKSAPLSLIGQQI